MGVDKLQSIQEKKKEKFEEKSKQKQEEEKEEIEGKKPVKEEKPKKKVEIKKPKVSEATGSTEYAPVSPKDSAEVCKNIKGKNVDAAIRILNDAISLSKPIKYYRYTKDASHRKGKGFGPGRFPVKASKCIKGVLENAIANGKYLELDSDRLYVKKAVANRAISKEHGGKYSHIEITVAESKEEKKPKKEKKKNKKVKK